MSVVPRIVKNALRPIVISALTTWERMESGVAYNPTLDSVRNNPYEKYAELRSKDPIHRMRLINAWVLTRYEDVDMVLRDHRRFSNHDDQDREYRSMLFLDPPDHTRLRSLVSKAFTPKSVAELEPKILRLVQELLDNIEGKDRFDLISDFAFPLPVTVIAEMLGVPAQDIDKFRDWSNDIALSVEPTLDDEQTRRMEESFLELLDYFEDIIEQRQREPREDMITALLNVEAEGDRLSRDDLLATLTLLLVAGNETTRNFIGNGMLALLKHPDQLQRLRDNPHMLDSALNELLRYDSPVQMDQRMVYEDVEIDGNRIQAGQRVINAIGAANRDPAVFANPDELDIGRREKSHLSFGRGIHYCLGSPLAMLEGRAAFSALLDRFPSMKLVAEPEFREQVVLRGVEELWVEVE